ncbi:hypothetical protein WAI453_004289 [Rhynchosporium graminicola]
MSAKTCRRCRGQNDPGKKWLVKDAIYKKLNVRENSPVQNTYRVGSKTNVNIKHVIGRLRLAKVISINCKLKMSDSKADPTRLSGSVTGKSNSGRTSQRHDHIGAPIYLGEAACTAFATRLRRFLTSNAAAAHIPRTQYMSEEALSELSKYDVRWPSLTHAALLKVALHQAGRVYHMMCRDSTFEALKDTYETRNFDSPVNKCKFFSLFALGEVYSTRSFSSTGQVPGVNYYAKSLALIQILPERPTITHIENLLLLSLFSYSLNRRHHAFLVIGSAMRHALVIGMNHNIGPSQIVDPVAREHRVQIWWTIYIFDRMWESKMGIPNSILDEDIHVDMPTTISPKELHDAQFPDTEYATASVDLAKIAGEAITKTYSRKKYKETFLQRVQQLLKSLKS